MLKIRGKFGGDVKFDLTSTPNKIILNGSTQDFEILRTLVSETLDSVRETEAGDCPVCIDTPADPLTMNCGHVYCKSCFYHAASSCTNLPFRCSGNDTTCEHAFGLGELKYFLPLTRFDALFEAAFGEYVKTHPNQL